MKIKDCLACKLSEEGTVGFMQDVIVNMITYESLDEALEGWYDDCKSDPEASPRQDFLDHMSKDHRREICNAYEKVYRLINKVAREVF